MAPPPPVPGVVLPYHSYTWIFAVSMMFAFLDGYSIGANDVANSFATSVGSRSLKLWQAVCIACFTEFGGAILLGATTTSTVKDGIINTSLFKNRPDLLMSGFMCALMASSTWVMFATYMGWPVSTTHSIIGALIGIGVSAFGFDAVNWGWDNKGVAQIATSWFLSPILAGLIAATVYTITKYAVLRRRNSLMRGIWAIPFYFTITLFIVSFYVVSKNGKSTLDVKLKNGQVVVQGNVGLCFGIVGAITAAVALFCVGFMVPYFYRRLAKEEKLPLWRMLIIWCTPTQPHDPLVDLYLKQMFTPHTLTLDDKRALGMEVEDDMKKRKSKEEDEDALERAEPRNPFMKTFSKIKKLLYNSIFIDVATVQHDNKGAVVAHEIAILYDNKTEYLYSMLQVVTACFASFAHGSNDVANALGPLAGVYQIWEEGTFTKTASVPVWMLAYAGAAIDCGLALYGYNIMKNLGNNITYHSPSRGFCMELGAALAVITASFLALPVSTTQCIVGATVAVGLCNGQFRAINWSMVAWCFFSWFLTLPWASCSSGILYAFITRGPSFTMPPTV